MMPHKNPSPLEENRQSFREINEQMKRTGQKTFWQLLATSSWAAILTIVGIVGLMVAILSAIYLLPNPREIDLSFSPNLRYEVRVYTISSNKKEGAAIYLDVHDKMGKKIRSKVFEQWYCVNAELEWKNDKTLVVNGLEMNILEDTVYLEEKTYPSANTSGDLSVYCPDNH